MELRKILVTDKYGSVLFELDESYEEGNTIRNKKVTVIDGINKEGVLGLVIDMDAGPGGVITDGKDYFTDIE